MSQERRSPHAGAEQQRGALERRHQVDAGVPKAVVEAYQAKRNATSRSEQRQARRQKYEQLGQQERAQQQDSGQKSATDPERGDSQNRSASGGLNNADSARHTVRDRSDSSPERRQQTNADTPSAPMSGTERRRARKAKYEKLGAKESAEANRARSDSADGQKTSSRGTHDTAKKPESAMSSDRTNSGSSAKDQAQPVSDDKPAPSADRQAAPPEQVRGGNVRDGSRQGQAIEKEGEKRSGSNTSDSTASSAFELKGDMDRPEKHESQTAVVEGARDDVPYSQGDRGGVSGARPGDAARDASIIASRTRASGPGENLKQAVVDADAQQALLKGVPKAGGAEHGPKSEAQRSAGVADRSLDRIAGSGEYFRYEGPGPADRSLVSRVPTELAVKVGDDGRTEWSINRYDQGKNDDPEIDPTARLEKILNGDPEDKSPGRDVGESFVRRGDSALDSMKKIADNMAKASEQESVIVHETDESYYRVPPDTGISAGDAFSALLLSGALIAGAVQRARANS